MQLKHIPWVLMGFAALANSQEPANRTPIVIHDAERIEGIESSQIAFDGVLEVSFSGKIDPHEALMFTLIESALKEGARRFDSVELPGD